MTRPTINKILTISGGLTALTGLFLMVHYESHFSIVIHNIAGLIFIIFSLLHIKFNFKGIKNSFTSNASKYVMVFLFIGCAAIAAIKGSFV
jgi:hypothetical protein